jgi:hypothetical protein
MRELRRGLAVRAAGQESARSIPELAVARERSRSIQRCWLDDLARQAEIDELCRYLRRSVRALARRSVP